MPPTRRTFLKSAAGAALGAAALPCSFTAGCAHRPSRDAPTAPQRILFRARGETPGRSKLGVIAADGTGERYLDCDVPGQVGWSYGPVFADGRRVILMSVEGERTWEHHVRSHLWIYDLQTGALTAIAAKNRPAAYMPPCALLPGEERLIVNPVIDGEQRVFTMNLDGSGQVEVTRKGDGFTYGVSLSPGARRIAFHATGTHGYQIFVCNLDGSGRTRIAGDPAHLYFGPTWSHDGQWLLYLDCHHRTDPGHDWADICIARPGRSERRVITENQSHWFGTSYGGPQTRGSGSNIPQWSPTAPACTYTRALPGSRTAWPFQTNRPDTDHFNREYDPEHARGGTEICLLDPFKLTATPLTKRDPQATALETTWDFRTAWSPTGTQIAFCRSQTGRPSELWIMNADGSEQRFLTRGVDGLGVDHPGWG